MYDTDDIETETGHCEPGHHTWVGGMCYVHNEDVAGVAEERARQVAAGTSSSLVECETCGKTYAPGDEWPED